MDAIYSGTVSPFSWYQLVNDRIVYGYITDSQGITRSDLNGFYRDVLLYFAYPDGNGQFVTRLYTKFENSDQYSTNLGQPRTDVLYYINDFRFRWNNTRDGFDKVREFSGILADSPEDVTTQPVDGGLINGEEDGNAFDMIVPEGSSFNYNDKAVVYDQVRGRFILKWTQNYTLSDNTTQDFTLYFTESVLLAEYVDNNNYHPKTDSVYQDVTNSTNYPLYRWNGSSFAHIDDTDVTKLYRISGTMEITLSDDYIVQHIEQ